MPTTTADSVWLSTATLRAHAVGRAPAPAGGSRGDRWALAWVAAIVALALLALGVALPARVAPPSGGTLDAPTPEPVRGEVIEAAVTSDALAVTGSPRAVAAGT